MKGAGHLSAPRGRRVLVLMKDGSHFVARFHRNLGDGVIRFTDHDPVRTHHVRTLSFYRGQPSSAPEKAP